jgi:ABC-type nitrate/sulfonate/bicarbonate transport system permease component
VVVLPLIYEATLMGLENIDKSIKDEIKLLTKPNFYVFRKVYLPITFPFILTSLIQSVGLGLKVLVMAEFISNAKHSIGYEIMLYKDHYNEMSYVYAWSIILIVFILIVDYIINRFKSKNFVYY